MGDRDNRGDRAARADRADWVKLFWKAKNGITDSLTHLLTGMNC